MMDFEQMCGSVFWDANLTWNVPEGVYPDVTTCMENVCLTWIPCAFLWFIFLPYILSLKVNLKGRTPQPLTKFTLFKSLFPVLVAGVDIAHLLLNYIHDESPGVSLFSTVVSTATLALAGCLVHVYRIYGQFSSGPLFTFWSFTWIASLFRTYIYWKRFLVDGLNEYEELAILYSVSPLLTFTALLLSSFTDASKEVLQLSKGVSPEVTASFPAYISFYWMQTTMKVGHRKTREGGGIEREDLYELSPPDRVHFYYPEFERDWLQSIEKYKQRHPVDSGPPCQSGQEGDDSDPLVVDPTERKKNKGGPSLVLVLTKHFFPILALGWGMSIIARLENLINPAVQYLLIAHMETLQTDNPEPLWKGIMYSIFFLTDSCIGTLGWNVLFLTNMKSRTRIKSALIAAIYKKSLLMSGDARKESTTGEIVNLMAVDTSRTVDFISQFWVFLTSPIQAAVIMYMLYQLLGDSVFAGVAMLFLAAPFSFLIGYFQRKVRLQAMKIKDERIKLIKETLSSIKVIKLYAWETSFQHKISQLRQKEIVKQRIINMLIASQSAFFDVIPILVTLVTFAIYSTASADHTLKASTAFVSLSLFDSLKYPFTRLATSISSVISASVSVTRISNYFMTSDLDKDNVQVEPHAEYAIEVKDGTFSHIKGSPAVLHQINLQVKEGSLVAVVGSVGVGKSSLLSALIGDMYKHHGLVQVKSSMAYVAQQAFILNASVRNNILFGLEYEEERYNRVVEACALTADLDMLPSGDKSIIGEKGINISGGQKQRISLARAVYSQADIFLLDDPLSAVDAHVGRHIFDNIIGDSGLLSGKTRLMVTHGVHWLPNVDEIYVLNNGRITEHGSYNSLLSHEGDFAAFIKTYFLQEKRADVGSQDGVKEGLEEVSPTLESQVSAAESNVNSVHGGQAERRDSVTSLCSEAGESDSDIFDEMEEVQTGNVSLAVYKTYFKAMGWKAVTVGTIFVVLSAGLDLYSSVWLSMWTGDKIFLNDSQSANEAKKSAMEMYLIGLSALSLAQVFTVLCYVLLAAYCFYQASRNLHGRLLFGILRAKVSFFDVKPLGMILNRFSKDVDILDNNVGWSVVYLAAVLAGLVASVGGIIYTTPLFVIAVVPFTALYLYIQRYYISTARQLRRLVSKASSPIYSHFSETLSGCQTIRAYGHQQRFLQDNVDKVEKLNVFEYFDEFADCWLDVRMYASGGILLFFTAFFCVISTRIPFLGDHLTPSLVGLALTLVLQVTDVLTDLVWVVSNVETNIVAVERIKEYSEVEKEDDWSKEFQPPRGWPTQGSVQFDKFSTRYRPELDLVIRDFSLHINPGEKIGIVGRTGAGKSSLTLSLFRLLEAAEGCIRIDGVDISQLGLHQLRSNVSILPQDPVLFSGTIRENLDPFSNHGDETLWQVLGQCQLREFVKELASQLSADCGEGGSNLSVGQRQLVCLARALLRKSKILIMDEATGSVDLKTDDFIQKAIRREFSTCTVLTIAHRLNTVIDYDRIMVMSGGGVAEFDSPQNLLANENGLFYSMAKHAGIVSTQE